MSIRTITIDQLRRMEDQEGLVLQGCGGSAKEWLDGINRMLTANGCLKNGTVFTDVHVFQKDGSTCLLFPFSDDTKLDMGKLAVWRLRSHDRFGGTWLEYSCEYGQKHCVLSGNVEKVDLYWKNLQIQNVSISFSEIMEIYCLVQGDHY